MAREETRVVGLLGAGRQAGGQVWGFDAVFDLDTVRVYSPTRKNRESFAAEWTDRLDAEVVAVDDPLKAVAGANVLACATNSMEPVLEPDWIESGMHVSAIKNPEVPDEAFHRVDRVAIHTHTSPFGPHNFAPRGSDFGDRLDHAWSVEGFDALAVPELADLVDAGIERRDPDETTMFVNNLGTGVQFAAVGRHVHDEAVEAGIGREVETDYFLQSMW